MQPAIASRTALRVALRRAAHQIHDEPLVFDDPVAVPILGPIHAEELRRTPLRPDRPFSTSLRAFIVARSRLAEDNLGHAVTDGVRQYVLLGAGLDTFAYRNPYPQLRVFEVDHPATQEWKRDLLQRNPTPSVEEIKSGIEGNFCRCTGYQQIIEAVLDASGQLTDEAKGELKYV